jgi:LytT family two-component system response regulator NatR
MIRVGLVDDQKYDLEKLIITLENESNIKIIFSTNNSEEAYKLIKENEIDLLITDIEMPMLSGYELADFIRSYGMDIKVIFVTGHSGYAVHAFDLDILDYIMKPFSKERLQRGINRLQKKFHVRDKEKLILKTKSEIFFIDRKKIIYIERTGRSTTIFTGEGKYTSYQTLNELEKELAGSHFVRAHRGFIINIHYVNNFSLYTKNSYIVHFKETKHTAMITKNNLDRLQDQFFN